MAACVVGGGWQRDAYMATGVGACMAGGRVAGVCIQERRPLMRAVPILLECILVIYLFVSILVIYLFVKFKLLNFFYFGIHTK